MVRFRPHVVLRWYTYYHASTALTWSFGNDVSSCLSEMDHKSYRKTSRIPSSLVEPHNGLLNREAIHKDSNLPEIHAMSRHIWIRLTHALQCSQTHMGFFFYTGDKYLWQNCSNQNAISHKQCVVSLKNTPFNWVMTSKTQNDCASFSLSQQFNNFLKLIKKATFSSGR